MRYASVAIRPDTRYTPVLNWKGYRPTIARDSYQVDAARFHIDRGGSTGHEANKSILRI